ncbi:MAG: hypothetical protein ACJA2D_002876 [Pseudohongiellaceae bacterium]|jgi:hypothetical protein
MQKKELVQNWRERIITLCESKLGRKLMAKEVDYISSLNTFLALEYLQNEAELAATNELEIHLEEVVSLFENSNKS